MLAGSLFASLFSLSWSKKPSKKGHKRAPRHPRGLPRQPQETSKGAPDKHKPLQNCVFFSMFLAFSTFRPKRPPRRPQDGPRGPRQAPRRPKRPPKTAQEGPKTAQEGPRRPKRAPRLPKRAPRRPKKGPNRTSQEPPKSAKRGPEDSLKWCPDSPRGFKDDPQRLPEASRYRSEYASDEPRVANLLKIFPQVVRSWHLAFSLPMSRRGCWKAFKHPTQPQEEPRRPPGQLQERS